MSALAKLKSLMSSLKVIEHERWDTAAHAVLELEKKIGHGAHAPAADLALSEQVKNLEGQVAELSNRLATLSAKAEPFFRITTVEAEPAPPVEPASTEPAPQA